MTDPTTGLKIDPEGGARIRHAYDAENGYDEIAYLFPAHSRGVASIPFNSAAGVRKYVQVERFGETATDTHHISGGILGTPRYDLVSNLIRLSRLTHGWCERYTFDGFAVCMAAKLIKFEWDGPLMAKIMRVDTVEGWLASREFEFDWPRKLLEVALRELPGAPTGAAQGRAALANDLTARVLRRAWHWRDA